jgi:hypothetical protein
MRELGRQPLFQLIGAVIVLLAADWRPVAGLVAAVLWIVWVAISFSSVSTPASRLFTTH